jgi:hypothetical protein
MILPHLLKRSPFPCHITVSFFVMNGLIINVTIVHSTGLFIYLCPLPPAVLITIVSLICMYLLTCLYLVVSDLSCVPLLQGCFGCLTLLVPCEF